jgi:hypothetical protein
MPVLPFLKAMNVMDLSNHLHDKVCPWNFRVQNYPKVYICFLLDRPVTLLPRPPPPCSPCPYSPESKDKSTGHRILTLPPLDTKPPGREQPEGSKAKAGPQIQPLPYPVLPSTQGQVTDSRTSCMPKPGGQAGKGKTPKCLVRDVCESLQEGKKRP